MAADGGVGVILRLEDRQLLAMNASRGSLAAATVAECAVWRDVSTGDTLPSGAKVGAIHDGMQRRAIRLELQTSPRPSPQD